VSGRPRGFDAQETVEVVRDLFWEQGFESTSLAQISRVSGLHKPSLYGAFGDRTDLFLAALEAYLATSREQVGAALSQERLRDAVTAFFDTDLAVFTPGHRGCFLLCVAMPAVDADPRVRDAALSAMDALDRSIRGRVLRADASELPPGISRELTSDLWRAVHVDLALAARRGEPTEVSRRRVQRFIRLFRAS